MEQNLLLLLAMVAGVLVLGASPSAALKDTFSVRMQFRAHNEEEKLSRLRELQLHQEELKQDQIERLISNDTGTSGAFPQQKHRIHKSSLITVPITFGENQTFEMTLDTGSSNLWITGSSCESKQCHSHGQFNHLDSDTFEGFESIPFQIEYGSGAIEGYMARDTITFGSGQADPINIRNQSFGYVTKLIGNTFNTDEWSGLVGLGYPALGELDGVPDDFIEPVFDNIMKLNVLNHNGFSFWLVNTPEHPPMFFLGAPPTEYYEGQLEFFPVAEKYYWSLRVEDILLDEESTGLCNGPKKCTVVVDSGTSYMSTPTEAFNVIMDGLKDGEESMDDACLRESNRTITYVMEGGQRYSLEPQDYYTKDTAGTNCRYKFMALDVEEPHGPLHIWGDVMFRKYFFHFDRDQDRIGIALAKKTGLPSSSSMDESNDGSAFLQTMLKNRLRSSLARN